MNSIRIRGKLQTVLADGRAIDRDISLQASKGQEPPAPCGGERDSASDGPSEWREHREPGKTGMANTERRADGDSGLPHSRDLAMYWLRKAAENGEFPPAENEIRHLWKRSRRKAK